MKIMVPAALAIAFATLPAPTVQANPMVDICKTRAAKNSGYSGSGLSRQVGNTTFRLSGSVAIGASRSSGPQDGHRAPAFAGQAATEQRDAQAKNKYDRIYNDCMRTR